MAKRKNTVEDLIPTFEANLKIDPNDLDNAVINHPEFYWHVCQEYALAISRRDEAKDALKQVDSDLFIQYKVTLEESGTRATEALVTSSIDTDVTHIQALEVYRENALAASLLESMKEAYEQRSYALKELVDMYCVNYNSQSSVDKRVEDARPAIARRDYTKRAADGS